MTEQGRVRSLRADNVATTFETHNKKFKLPIDAANYNAKYSMLLSAAINGSTIEIEASELAETDTGTHSVLAVTLL